MTRQILDNSSRGCQHPSVDCLTSPDGPTPRRPALATKQERRNWKITNWGRGNFLNGMLRLVQPLANGR